MFSDQGDVGTHGEIATVRYLNHRTLDLVQNQVDMMRSGMVRRIEWRVEQASALRRYFPEGECLSSTPFEAAGVDNLQMIFYPSGYTGAKEGFCSFFLHCPAGCFMRCWLSIGKQRREVRVTFDKPGYYGRSNFCRYDFGVNSADDSILLSLEIDEAQAEFAEPLSHSITVHSSDHQVGPLAFHEESMIEPSQQTTTDSVDIVEASSLSHQEKVESKIKLRRNPGRCALDSVRTLPSIWTSKPPANIAESLDGFHTFQDLKARKPQTARRPQTEQSGCPWLREFGNFPSYPMTSPKTAPVPKSRDDRYIMYT